MNIRTTDNGVAIIREDTVLLTDTQAALDLMVTVRYETGMDHIALNKEAIAEAFFDLRTGLAGEILQKFVNYGIKLAIVGDFSSYTSKALKDFIYECNNGRHVFFVSSEQEAVDMLTNQNG